MFVLLLLRTLKMPLLLFHLLHFLHAFLFFFSKAFHFLEIHLSYFRFSERLCFLRYRKFFIQSRTFGRQSVYLNRRLRMELDARMQKTVQ